MYGLIALLLRILLTQQGSHTLISSQFWDVSQR